MQESGKNANIHSVVGDLKEGWKVVKVLENLKELYKGEDVLNKHLCIGCISGITALLTDQEFIQSLVAQHNFLLMLAVLVVALAGCLYLFGYTIETVHYRLQAGITVLPEITTQPFKRIIGMAVIMLVWAGYTLIFGGVVLAFAFLVAAIKALAFIIVLLYALFIMFTSYVFIAYSKNFQAAGLMNIALPFKFMKEGFVDTIILTLKFTVLCIVLTIPLVVIFMLLGVISKTFGLGLAICVGGYFSFIIQLLWYNCLADIYEEKLQDEVEELY